MNPKDFLKDRLSEIFNNVKSINIRYQYCEMDDTHIVEVTPVFQFNDNEAYIALERELLFDFNDLFFPSTLLFISEESLVKIDNPDFSFMRDMISIKNTIDFDWLIINSHTEICSGENNYALAA